MKLPALVLAAAALLLSACFVPPQVQDPLEGLASPADDAALKSLSVGLRVSPNTLETLKYQAHVDSQYAEFVRPIPDLTLAVDSYVTFLQSHFKSVSRLEGGSTSGADVVAVLDMHIDHLAATVFEHDAFTMKTVFLTPDRRPLGEATGHWRTGARGYTHGPTLMQEAVDHAQHLMETSVLTLPELRALARQRAGAAPAVAAAAPAAPRVYRSDVDDPGYFYKEDPRKFAVVVGIENYSGLPAAQFAERDADAMRKHLVALGYPERHIVLLDGQRATLTGIQKYVEQWLPSRVKEDSEVFFYFSGHGAPDTSSNQAYLVPWDGDPKYLSSTGYPLERLYKQLGALKAKKVVVALDSCFSGAGGRSVLAQGLRPLVNKLNEGSVGRLVVLSASGPDEVTGTEESQGHGLFTYQLLKALQASRGKASVKSLFETLAPRVEDDAHRDGREQTPRLLPSPAAPGAAIEL